MDCIIFLNFILFCIVSHQWCKEGRTKGRYKSTSVFVITSVVRQVAVLNNCYKLFESSQLKCLTHIWRRDVILTLNQYSQVTWKKQRNLGVIAVFSHLPSWVLHILNLCLLHISELLIIPIETDLIVVFIGLTYRFAVLNNHISNVLSPCLSWWLFSCSAMGWGVFSRLRREAIFGVNIYLWF